MKTKILMLITSVFFLSTGCLFDSSDVENDPTKKEVQERKKNGDTKDYCEIFNWYGDGKCDDFCIEQDIDCAVTCGALPRCPDGTIEVFECANQTECEEVQVCQSTIYCVPESCGALDPAPVQCPEGYSVSDVCDTSNSDKPCIDYSTNCGGALFCNPDPVVACLALPACGDGFFEVEKCRLNDSQCADATICEHEISCAPNLDCDSVPFCADDEIEYRSKAECENAGSACRQAYECNSVIWCGGKRQCLAPDCGATPAAPDCQDPEQCYEVFGCGAHVICENQ